MAKGIERASYSTTQPSKHPCKQATSSNIQTERATDVRDPILDWANLVVGFPSVAILGLAARRIIVVISLAAGGKRSSDATQYVSIWAQKIHERRD